MSKPYPPKPFFLAAVTELARVLGRERLARWLAVAYASELMIGRMRRLNKSRLRRILAFRGEPASQERLEELIRSIGAVYAEHMAELFSFDPRRPDLRAVELPLERIASARAAGRGVILASPHFGNAALAMAALPAAGIPLTVVLIDAVPFLWLEALGIKPVSVGRSAIEVTRALAAGEAVWINVDIDFFPDGRSAPLFGAPVRPPHGAARLALASGAPILPVYPVRSAGGWRLAADEPIMPDGAAQEAVEDLLLRSVERFAARHPDHWWIFLDLWDLPGIDARTRAMLARVRFLGRLRRLLGAG